MQTVLKRHLPDDVPHGVRQRSDDPHRVRKTLDSLLREAQAILETLLHAIGSTALEVFSVARDDLSSVGTHSLLNGLQSRIPQSRRRRSQGSGCRPGGMKSLYELRSNREVGAGHDN